jgi:shikimate kinase
MWLVGMMGSGKSTVGAAAARALHVPFFDTDAMVVATAGRSIAEIWESDGESGFRALERMAVSSVPDGRRIAAAGGGAVVDAANRRRMRGDKVVWLQTRPEVLASRVATDGDRPLLAGSDTPAEKLLALLESRLAHYESVATDVVDTSDLTPEETVRRVVELWPY